MFETDKESSGMDFAKAELRSPGYNDSYAPEPEEDSRRHELDNAKNTKLFRLLTGYYLREIDRQAENRREMAIDADFYDNDQWSAEDAETLKERGQMPLVINVISQSINWIIGSEKRSRMDFKILPRRKDSSKPAERKTQLLKYLSDVNATQFNISRAFEDTAKVGVGWVEDSVQDDDDGEPVANRYESWRNILWDSLAQDKDLNDGRYIFRTRWVDVDIANAMFPDRKGIIFAAATTNNVFGTSTDYNGDDYMDSREEAAQSMSGSRDYQYEENRRRVRLIEAWYRMPEEKERMRGGDFAGEIYDETSPGHRDEIESGRAETSKRVMLRTKVAIFCTEGLLYAGESPYRHNRYPFTPIWAYRRDRDGMPYGFIRLMRDMQADINKRHSKALHILSTNKTIMDEGAVPDIEEFREEVSRPDAVIVKKQGKELVLNAERELSASHLQLMSQMIGLIQTVSGVTDENLGRSTNATSGKAIGLRQDQGSMATAGVFDNLRFAFQKIGEKQLSLIEQFFTEQKQFRITNSRGTPEYVTINDDLPENDIVRTKADFIISDSDWRATVRQAQTEELMGLLSQLAPVAPQVAVVMLDLLVEGMDIPSREELVKRIRQVTGMRDPDADELTPEEQAELQAKQQAQQQQAELQMRAAMAAIAKDESTAMKNQADASKIQATIRQILAQVAGQNVDTQAAALAAAMGAMQAPGIVPVADTILNESGFISRSEEEQQAQQQAIAEAQAQQQQAQAQQQAEQQQAEQQAAQQQQAQQPPSGIQGQGLSVNQ